MSSGPPSYPYQPLNSQDHEIRLLCLRRIPPAPDSRESSRLSYSLVHASLDTRPRYTALSYVWGDPTEKLPILVDGHTVLVTQNLHHALIHLERTVPETGGDVESSVNLWVDALCIKQSDVVEKNVQVRLMSRIYGDADSVVVWLGPDDDGRGGAALHMLGRLGSLFREVRTSPGFDNAKIAAFVKLAYDYAAPAPGRQTSGTFDFQLIWRLFRQRPWWWRVWIIQEVVLAKRALVYCGHHSVPWEDVRESLQVFEWILLYPSPEPEHRRTYSIVADIYPNVAYLGLAYDEYQRSLREAALAQPPAADMSTVGMSLVDTILLTATGTGDTIQATDPRDRIYGLLGMVRRSEREKVPIDYAEDVSLSKVLFTVGKALVELSGPIVFILCRETSLSPTLPSWVPDWTAPRIAVIGDVHNREYNAANGVEWSSVSIDASYQAPALSLQALLPVIVRKVGSEFDPVSAAAAKGSSYYSRWLQDLQDMVADAGGRCPGAIPGPLNQADIQDGLWRVPMADRGLIGRADKEDSRRFKYGYDILTGALKPPGGLNEDEISAWALSETWDYRRVWKLKEHRSFVDDAGRPGLGPRNMDRGDQIAIFPGGYVPYVVRRAEGATFRLLGPAYVFGLMDGEALSETSFQEIQLI